MIIDIIGIVLTVWANVIATIALIHTIKKDKEKPLSKCRDKPKRKR